MRLKKKKKHTSEMAEFPAMKCLVGCKWVFTFKYNSDGSNACHKVQLIQKGFIDAVMGSKGSKNSMLAVPNDCSNHATRLLHRTSNHTIWIFIITPRTPRM